MTAKSQGSQEPNLTSPEPAFIKIDDIIDRNELRAEQTHVLKLDQVPINDNPNYKVYFFDVFSSSSDLEQVVNYLKVQGMLGFCSVCNESRKAIFLSISTIKYGFVFNLNEDIEETKEYAKSHDLTLPSKFELLKSRPQFLSDLRNILSMKNSYKITLCKERETEAISKISAGLSLNESQKEKIL